MTDKKSEIKLFVPAPLLERAKAIADSQGLSLSEFNRYCWMVGLYAAVDQDLDLRRWDEGRSDLREE